MISPEEWEEPESELQIIERRRDDIMEAWLVALRGKEYRQTRNKMYCRETAGYCCLGVLADVLVEQFGVGHWKDGLFYIEKDTGMGSLPAGVAEILFGIAALGREMSLQIMNDGDKADFPTISDHIESVLL